MLYVNVDLILELLNANILPNESNNRLSYYNLICESDLIEDIKFTKKEKDIITSFGNGIKENESIHIEKEKELFTKIFVGNYLLKNKYIEIEDDEDLYMKPELFSLFATNSLKTDKSFAKTILQLDGTYIKYMGNKIKNNRAMMNFAIENDETKDVESFVFSDSDLKFDSEIALNYFKRLKINKKDNYSTEETYENIFKKADEDQIFSREIFSKGEQLSWLNNPIFLKQLIKIDDGFIDYVSDGRISKVTDGNKDYKVLTKGFNDVNKKS